jgi:cyclopropane fatty-acyl-phospholipid synthase-like methyltransferase
VKFNREQRLEHWSTGWTAKNQGDSDPAPFIDYAKYYVGSDVLEIGPGEGRAYEVIRRVVESYAIADISQQVLDCPVWNGIQKKFLLRGYEDIPDRFDVVHFWYVLHHVPRCELWDFFEWVMNCLKRDGMLLFNTPFLGFHEGAYKDDGVQTTRYQIGEITSLLEPWFQHLYIDGTKLGASNGHIYVGRKL